MNLSHLLRGRAVECCAVLEIRENVTAYPTAPVRRPDGNEDLRQPPMLGSGHSRRSGRRRGNDTSRTRVVGGPGRVGTVAGRRHAARADRRIESWPRSPRRPSHRPSVVSREFWRFSASHGVGGKARPRREWWGPLARGATRPQAPWGAPFGSSPCAPLPRCGPCQYARYSLRTTPCIDAHGEL